MNFHNRLAKIEASLASRPCAACAALPRVVLIDTAADQSRWEAQRQQHQAECTCRVERTTKLIFLHRAD